MQEPIAPQESGARLAAFRYSCKNPSLQSETVHYKRGVSQQFSLPSFKIDFSEWKDDEVTGGAPTFSYSFLGFSVFCLVHYTGCQGDPSWPWHPGNGQVFVLGQICRGTRVRCGQGLVATSVVVLEAVVLGSGKVQREVSPLSLSPDSSKTV